MSAFPARLTLARFTLSIVILLQLSTAVIAGPLDDYYLQQFGEAKKIQLQKALLSVTSEIEESARCGMPLKHGLKRDWNLLEQSTQKTLAKQLALPALAGEATFTSAAGHFKVHYATSGTDAPPLADLNNNGVPDWVETVAATFENVYANYSTQGYQLAPTKPTGAPYDIFLLDLAPQRFYGMTTSDQPASSATYLNAVTSWMEIDNNFTDPVYSPATYSPLQSLQITAAHEYHHAVQYGYTLYFDVWYAEATSTWMEDELYDGVNQLYNYIPAWFNNSSHSLDIFLLPPDDTSQNMTLGYGYGRWIFNRYLSEKHGPTVIRSVWEKVGGRASPGNGTDIPMVPVLDSVLSSATYGTSLGADFFGFTKRVYNTNDWTAHKQDIGRIHPYTPVTTYSAFPVNSTVSAFKPSIALSHYSFAYFRFIPASGSPPLTIKIAKSDGIQTAVFRKSPGTATATEIAINAGGDSYTDNAFGSSEEVVLLIANTTNTDGQNANFSTDGSTTAVTEPSTTPVTQITPVATTPTTSTPDVNGNGKGSSCFIATAAYGSYLHPHVQQLRQFRDDYLMTNAPGRAFVALYYRFSPPLADFISRHALLRGMVRLLLTPVVVAIMHPAASGVALSLAALMLFRPLRRRLLERIAVV